MFRFRGLGVKVRSLGFELPKPNSTFKNVKKRHRFFQGLLTQASLSHSFSSKPNAMHLLTYVQASKKGSGKAKPGFATPEKNDDPTCFVDL